VNHRRAGVDATLFTMQSHTESEVGADRAARTNAKQGVPPGASDGTSGDVASGEESVETAEAGGAAHATDAQDAAGAEGDDPVGEVCGELPLESRVEALLVASDRPLSESRLAGLLGIAAKGSAARLQQCVAALNEQYDVHGRAFRIERLAGGYQVLTRAAFGPLLLRQHRDRQQSRLTPSAMETLSIIAYRQPVLRAEIEAIRGVACGEVLRGLLERRLIRIAGRAEELGRPMLYGTTQEFLRTFGLASLDDLPDVAGDDRQRTRGQNTTGADV